MHAIQRLDKGHVPSKRDELYALQKANHLHSIIQGIALGVTAVVVIIVLVVLCLVKRRRKNIAVQQIKDGEADDFVELRTNNVSRRPVVSPPRPNSPYMGDRFPDGVIGSRQSPRVRAQTAYKNPKQSGNGELHGVDLSEAKQLA